MFVQHLGIETDGKMALQTEPQWPQIQVAIQNLDGQHATMVVLEATQEIHMAICGGTNGWCVVGVVAPEKKHYCLTDPAVLENPGEIIGLPVTGTSGGYPREMLVPLSMALGVAKLFAEQGKLAENVVWKQQAAA